VPIVKQGYADGRLGLLVLDVIRMEHVTKVFFLGEMETYPSASVVILKPPDLPPRSGSSNLVSSSFMKRFYCVGLLDLLTHS
jgi:hypothetical protein